MDNEKIDNKIIEWLTKLIKEQFGDYSIVQIIRPEHVLSKIADPILKNTPNISSWDFQPDILIILKKQKAIEFIIVTRHKGGFGLKELGEINCYTRIMKPLKSYIVSANGVSNELAIMLLDESIKARLLTHPSFKAEINIVTFDRQKDAFSITY